jgi:hypothetical protein
MTDIQAGDLIEYVGPAKVQASDGFTNLGWVDAPSRGAIRTCSDVRVHPLFAWMQILRVGDDSAYWVVDVWRKVYRPRPEIFAGVLTSALAERVAEDGVAA